MTELADLTSAELDVLADEFVIISHLTEYPRLAGWGRRQGYLVMAELTRRCDIDPGPTPEIVTLDDLPKIHRPLALRRLFERLADVEDIEGADRPIPRWVRERDARPDRRGDRASRPPLRRSESAQGLDRGTPPRTPARDAGGRHRHRAVVRDRWRYVAQGRQRYAAMRCAANELVGVLRGHRDGGVCNDRP